jgi:hypothetical protein
MSRGSRAEISKKLANDFVVAANEQQSTARNTTIVGGRKMAWDAVA